MAQTRSILLISCYELGHQPLGLASPLAFLEQAGYPAETLDIAVQPFDEEKAATAWFVGISVPMHTALRLGMRLAARVRRLNPTCHICFYGLYAALNARHLLGQLADSVIGGEYEAALVSLVAALSAGSSAPIIGVSGRNAITAPVLQRLTFPIPNRQALPDLALYAHLNYAGRHQPTGYVEATRGCLHTCLHCPIPPAYNGRFFIVPRETVLADVRRLVQAGAAHITFGDPDFLNGPTHSLHIIQDMNREFPTLTFDFTAKVEHLLQHQRLLPTFHDCGCLFIVSAFESLSSVVLTELHKGHSSTDLRTALALVKVAGITLRPTWVAFTPWTTLDDYLLWLTFIEQEALIDHIDPVQYSIRLLLPPGSSLLAHPGIQPYLGDLDEATFSYRWTHPDPRMDQLQQALSTAIETAIRLNTDPAIIFQQVTALAYTIAGRQPPLARVPLLPSRQRPPRLTESWFC